MNNKPALAIVLPPIQIAIFCDLCTRIFYLDPEEHEILLFSGDDFVCPTCNDSAGGAACATSSA